MDRRLFLTAAAAALAAPMAHADGRGHVTFSNAAFEEALASGEPLLLDFFAPW